jgi:hypothetical protein
VSSPYPRVTKILADVGLGPDLSHVPEDVLTRASERGTAVHALIEAEAYGYLDPVDITAEAAPYLDAYRKFVAESGAKHIASEFEVTHPAWRYVGHPDQLVWLAGRRVLLDYKTGTAEGVAYQLAAYVDARNAQTPDEPVAAALPIMLRKDGTYRIGEEVVLAPALQVFQAALIVFHAKARRKESA